MAAAHRTAGQIPAALAGLLHDPWAILVAALAVGAAWATGVPWLLAPLVGTTVFAVYAAAEVVGRKRTTAGRRLPVRQTSTERGWLTRAEGAVQAFRHLSASAAAGPLAERCRLMGTEAVITLDAMRRLAGQVSAVAGALERVNRPGLAGEDARLTSALKAAKNPEVHRELQRSLGSVRVQLDVHTRLEQASRMLLARLESGALGLEGLVARLAEILALAETATPIEADQQIDALVDELDGLRAGLVETEDVSRRALTAYQGAD